MRFTKTLQSITCTSALLIATMSLAGEPVGGGAWKARMRSMLGDVLVLFPYAFDTGKFNDPKNAEVIQSSLQALTQKSDGLKNHVASLKIDPSFPFIAEAFASDLAFAESTFAQGDSQRSHAQDYLRAALAKCMMCHTQSANGPELKLDKFQSQLSALSPIDRFTALATTRQFDEALSEFDKILDSSKVTKPAASTFDQATREALAIVIRVKADPDRALTLIEKISESGASSAMIQGELKSWKQSVKLWKAEKPVALNSDQALFDEAKRLIDESKEKLSSLDNYQNSGVELLRASADLHNLLSKYPHSSLRAQSYFQLATVYDLLPGFAIWDLADGYLEACIEQNPHSAIAVKCYDRYENNTTLGYTGSAGTHVPKAVTEHLKKMNELAKPSKAAKPEDPKK